MSGVTTIWVEAAEAEARFDELIGRIERDGAVVVFHGKEQPVAVMIGYDRFAELSQAEATDAGGDGVRPRSGDRWLVASLRGRASSSADLPGGAGVDEQGSGSRAVGSGRDQAG